MSGSTYTWTSTTSGNWNLSGAWTPGTVANSATAYPLIAPNGSPTITLNSATFTIGTLDLENPTGGTNGATLTWGVAARALTVSSNVIINTGTVSLASGESSNSKLTINGTGTALQVFSGGTLLQAVGTIAAGSGSSAATSFGGTETFSGGIFNDPGALTVTTGPFTESGTAALTITGQANFTGGTNSISGGTFNVGTLTIGTALTLSGGTVTTTTSSGASIGSGKTLTMSGGPLNVATGGLADSGTVIGFGTLTGSITQAGVVEASGGTLNLTTAAASTARPLRWTVPRVRPAVRRHCRRRQQYHFRRHDKRRDPLRGRWRSDRKYRWYRRGFILERTDRHELYRLHRSECDLVGQ